MKPTSWMLCECSRLTGSVKRYLLKEFSMTNTPLNIIQVYRACYFASIPRIPSKSPGGKRRVKVCRSLGICSVLGMLFLSVPSLLAQKTPDSPPLQIGPVQFVTVKVENQSFIDLFKTIDVSANLIYSGHLDIKTDNQPPTSIDIESKNLDGLLNEVRGRGYSAKTEGTKLVISPGTSASYMSVTGNLSATLPPPPQSGSPSSTSGTSKVNVGAPTRPSSKPPSNPQTNPNLNVSPTQTPKILDVEPETPVYSLSLSEESSENLKTRNKDKAEDSKIHIHLHLDDGSVVTLDDEAQSWTLEASAKPMLFLTIGHECTPICTFETFDEIAKSNCHLEYLMVRRLAQKDLILAAKLDPQNLTLLKPLLNDTGQFVVVNGHRLTNASALTFDAKAPVTISVFRIRDGCRYYSLASQDYDSKKLYSPPLITGTRRANGIAVGQGKIFDVVTLRNMLSTTASQLASLSGFSSSSITGAYGNLQGVTRDTSYLSAQVTTTPLPTVSSTVASGTTGNNSLVNSSPLTGSSPGTVSLQCPDGSLPVIGSGGLQGCTANPSGAVVNGSSSTVTTVPPSTSQGTTGSTTSGTNSTTTTKGGYAGIVPTAPTFNPLSAPGNIGVASSDVLAEQVQLNSQITTLRLLLQGANSDQYLTSSSKVVGTRQQATLGFSVSLDPPRQFKHAVAEIRVVIVPPSGSDDISIMTLLPTEKTYNVAKITSKQKSFGAGVAVEAVSVGVNTGRSKDRLYLAKDTDTLALEYNQPSTKSSNLPKPQEAHDFVKSAIDWERVRDCNDDNHAMLGATVFGWQFRPVLGADYVKGGQRQVFAQLALPVGLDQDYTPVVYIQTRWRAYDPQKQVVGAAYEGSCSVQINSRGITLTSPLRVKDVVASDIGSGQVRLAASGDFFAPGMTVRSGSTSVVPTMFDGTSLEVFGSVHDLLQTGGLNIVSETGVPKPFGIPTSPKKEGACDVTSAELEAVPSPDGNSRARLHVTLGPQFRIGEDFNELNPFLLIGGQVLGTQEAPFLNRDFDKTQSACSQDSAHNPVECTYYFTAPTTLMRNAQTFTVGDLAWTSIHKRGQISFAPSFTGISILATYPPPPDPKKPAPANGSTQKPAQYFFTLSGYDLLKLSPNAPTTYSIETLLGNEVTDVNFEPETDNLATMLIDSKDLENAKAVRLKIEESGLFSQPLEVWARRTVEWDLAIPKAETPKLSVSPTYLHIGDSTKVSFVGGDLAKVISVSSVDFEGTALSADKFDVSAKTLKIIIPTSVTKTVGHKEITVTAAVPNDGGAGTKPTTIQLPIDVVRQ
jgi:hypothetical protein